MIPVMLKQYLVLKLGNKLHFLKGTQLTRLSPCARFFDMCAIFLQVLNALRYFMES